MDKKLYELVAPLVMNPSVLRQNNNYPFKTSFRHIWYVALENGEVAGFMPLKPSSSGYCIDNYYIRGDEERTIHALAGRISGDCAGSSYLSALVHKRHVPAFYAAGFRTFREWKKYDKMDYISSAGK